MEIKKLNFKTAIVTGGSGFIGTHLCQKLISHGVQVWNFDLRADSLNPQGAVPVKCDVRSQSEVAKAWVNADVVFHLAADVSVESCQQRPVESTQTNLLSTQVICQQITKVSKETVLLFASSSAVYGDVGPDTHSVVESSRKEPLGFYGYQKLWSEQTIDLFRRFHGLNAICFRLFNVYGPGQDLKSPYTGVISRFVESLAQREDLVLFNHGKNTRDFVHVLDVVDSMVIAAQKLREQRHMAVVINLGTGQAVPILEIAERLSLLSQKINGFTPRLLLEGPRSGDIVHSKAHVNLMTECLDWAPSRHFGDGLEALFRKVCSEI